MASDPGNAPAAATRWWRVGLMWMVVGGPLAVVVASFATLALAILNPDPVLAPAGASSPSEQPAVQARNHAANPTKP
jgi:hypothetical protein